MTYCFAYLTFDIGGPLWQPQSPLRLGSIPREWGAFMNAPRSQFSHMLPLQNHVCKNWKI